MDKKKKIILCASVAFMAAIVALMVIWVIYCTAQETPPPPTTSSVDTPEDVIDTTRYTITKEEWDTAYLKWNNVTVRETEYYPSSDGSNEMRVTEDTVKMADGVVCMCLANELIGEGKPVEGDDVFIDSDRNYYKGNANGGEYCCKIINGSAYYHRTVKDENGNTVKKWVSSPTTTVRMNILEQFNFEDMIYVEAEKAYVYEMINGNEGTRAYLFFENGYLVRWVVLASADVVKDGFHALTSHDVGKGTHSSQQLEFYDYGTTVIGNEHVFNEKDIVVEVTQVDVDVDGLF